MNSDWIIKNTVKSARNIHGLVKLISRFQFYAAYILQNHSISYFMFEKTAKTKIYTN